MTSYGARPGVARAATTPLAALQSIRAARPGGHRLFVIADNLSANKTPAIRTRAGRANAELCFTPASACHPDVLAAQRRERARIRSERQQRWAPRPWAA